MVRFAVRETHVRCEDIDIALGLALARGKDHAGIRLLATLSEGGSWEALLTLSAGTLACGLATGNRPMASTGRRMLGAGILASLTKTTIKRLVHRTRPNVMMETGTYARGWFGPNEGPWQSFPSGHAAVTVAVARALGRAYPELRTTALAGAAGIVAVQVLRGAHFPADVVAGTLIGLAAEAGVETLAASRRQNGATRPPARSAPTAGRCARGR